MSLCFPGHYYQSCVLNLVTDGAAEHLLAALAKFARVRTAPPSHRTCFVRMRVVSSENAWGSPTHHLSWNASSFLTGSLPS